MRRKLASERDVGLGSKLASTKLSKKVNGLLGSANEDTDDKHPYQLASLFLFGRISSPSVHPN